MRKNLGVKTYLYPQPTLVIATYNEDGSANAMVAAGLNQCGACPNASKTCE